MNSIVICVLLAVSFVAVQALEEENPVADNIKNIKYIYDGKEILETVRLEANEVSFAVVDSDVRMVLDYENEKMVFTIPPKENEKKKCYITSLDTEQIPLEEIKEKLKNLNSQKGEFVPLQLPKQTMEIDTQNSEKVVDVELGKLGKELCSDLEKRAITRAKTTALSTDLREKRDVGVGEVIVIILVVLACIFL